MDRSTEYNAFGKASPLAAYGVAVAAVAVATIVRWLLDPVLGNNVPYTTFYLAVVVAGWYGGLRPALLATLLSSLLAWALFVPPRFSFALHSTPDLVGLAVFLIVSLSIAGFSGTLREAERRCAHAEYRFREQAERLRTTLASIGDAVLTTDTEGRVTNLNGVAESLTGWTNESAIGQPLSRVFNIVNEETRQAVENPAIKALRDGVIVGLANHTVLIAKDGTERPIDDSAAPILCKAGEIVGCVLVFRDISDRKRLEAEQRDAESKVAKTIENITDGFMRLDQDWRVVYENAEAERLNQLPRSQTLGKTIWELFPAVVGTKFEAEYRRCVAEQIPIEFENFYEPWSRWYSLKCYPMADGGMSVYIRDITEHKRVEQRLVESEARYRAIGESIDYGVWLCDSTGRNTYASDSFLRMVGITQQQCSDFGWGDVLHPDDVEATIAAWKECVRTQGSWERVHRFKGVDERWHHVLAKGVPLRDATGQILGWAGLNLDVSRIVEAEQEVVRIAAESERQRRLYETVLTNTPDFVYVFSLDHKVLYANDALIKMWGRGRDGAIAKTFLEIGYEPWHAEMHDREIDQVVATRQPIRGEVPFNGTNGRRIYDYIFVPIIGADGEVEAVAGTTRDVTERHDAEVALRESEERSAFVRRSSGVGFWYCDLPFDVLQWDELVKAHFHLPPDAAVTIQTFYDRLHPDDREPTRKAIERSIAGRTPYNVDYRTVDSDTGSVKWVRAIGRTFYAADGAPTRFDGVTLDVSDQKRAEERQAFLIRLADTLRTLSDPIEVQAEASRVLGEHLGANRVVYFEIRGDEYVIERDYTAGVQPLAGRYPVAAFGPSELDALLNGRTVIEADATTEPDRPPGERAAFAAIQVRGHVDVPLVKDGRFVAGMTVQISDRRDWTQQEVALIEDTAERTWAAVERVRAEVALRQSEERRRLALDAAELGAFNIDPTTNSLTTDERFRIIFAGTTEPMDYEQAFAALHPDDRERIRKAVAAAIRPDDPAPYAEEYRVIHPDGSVRWIFAKGRAHYDREGPGRVVSFDGTIADITDRKLIEEERERLVGQLRDADRRKDEFLATLAHELRNPLAPVRNAVQLLHLKAPDLPELRWGREVIERQVNHLTRLIDDLLDISRITRNRLELRKQRVELAEVVQGAVETSRPVIEQCGHELSVTLPPEPVYLNADLVRLAQVFMNLLTNAAKYTEEKGRIWLSAERQNGEVVVSVKDTGVGIPADKLPQLFEMFFQVERTLERAQGGLGIGLSLVRRLVDLHGGTVEARSEGQNKGSEFIVRLPVLVEQQKLEGRGEATNQDATAWSTTRRIVVVDDNKDSASTLAMLLRLSGNEVHTAHDGLAGVELVERVRPNVVLLDIGMPKLNGYEACQRIREQPWGQDIVLIALTGWGQEEDRQQTAAAGFDVHMVKPVEHASLMKLLAELKPRSG